MLCPLLYRTKHISRGKKGRKGVEKRGGRGVASKGGKKEKRTRERSWGNEFPHGTERKTATVTERFAASKEQQQQSLHYYSYRELFPHPGQNKRKTVCNNFVPNGHAWLSRKGFCRNPRGIFPNKVPGEFCGGDFLVDFCGPFPWKKHEDKSTLKNPRQNSNQNLGEIRGPNPHCKDLALTTDGINLSETLWECHFPLRVAGRVAPNRVAPWSFSDSRLDSHLTAHTESGHFDSLDSPDQPEESFGPFGPEWLPDTVRQDVPENAGVRGSVPRGASGPGLRSVKKVSWGVSKRCPDTPGTPETPRGTLPRTPPFSGTLCRTLSGTPRARRARMTLLAGRGFPNTLTAWKLKPQTSPYWAGESFWNPKPHAKGKHRAHARLRGRTLAPSGNLLLRTPSENPSQNPFYCKSHSRPPSQHPSENLSPEPFPEPFLERCVAVRPLRRAPQKQPRAQRLKKFKIALRHWTFQARLKMSSKRPTKHLVSLGNSEAPGLKFSSEIEVFSEIENCKRDWFFFQSLNP